MRMMRIIILFLVTFHLHLSIIILYYVRLLLFLSIISFSCEALWARKETGKPHYTKIKFIITIIILNL